MKPRIDRMLVGEALVGDGNDVAHVDLLIGPRGSPVESAFASTLTSNKEGFISLLVVVEPNLLTKPATVMYNKVRIRGAQQAEHLFGPAQQAVARAVADSVEEGIIDATQADDLFICVGVFVHWLAEDDARIHEFNYQAVRLAIRRAVDREPSAAEVIARKPAAADGTG